jgi:hypothetical protein
MAFTTMALRPLFSTQGGASDLAKLVYNQNMKIMWGVIYFGCKPTDNFGL